MKLTGDIRCDFEKVTTENIKLKDRILGTRKQSAVCGIPLRLPKKSKRHAAGRL